MKNVVKDELSGDDYNPGIITQGNLEVSVEILFIGHKVGYFPVSLTRMQDQNSKG